MLITKITHSDVIALESELDKYLSESEVNFDAKIAEAKKILEDLISHRSLLLRKICTPLTLTDATKSDEDEIERRRVVINTTALTDEATILFEGTNDSDNETWSTVKDDIVITEEGEYTFKINDTYKYYRLTASGTITYTAYLVETAWELPHLYKSLELIYHSLNALSGDVYLEKAMYYKDLFNESFQNAPYSYDADDDDDVDETDVEVNRVHFRR